MEHDFMELRRAILRNSHSDLDIALSKDQQRRREACDPWVKVGTTTLDGTIMQVATLLDASGWGPPLTESEAESAIDLFMKQDERYHEPWLIGGRHLRARSSHVNASRGTALIRCDVVRRQSDLDAERDAAMQRGLDEAHRISRSIAKASSEPLEPCPECGPHVNRGEVLLASSWARCTTCNGGKSGDLWGEVKAEANPSTGTVRRSHDIDPRAKWTVVYFASGRSETYDIPPGATSVTIDDYCETVEFDVPVASSGSNIMAGFKVPTLIEMRGAELDNLLRYFGIFSESEIVGKAGA